MYMVTRACKVLRKLSTEVRRGTALVDFQDCTSICCWLQLDGTRRRLCTNQADDKPKLYSSKTLAQTKKEQRGWYDPTIKYEALRRCAVPRYAYYDVSATDWSDSSASDSEIETETMAEDEAQNQRAEEEQMFNIESYVSYGIPKEFAYSYIMYRIPKEIAYLEIYGEPEGETLAETESKTNTDTEIMIETQIRREKILAGINDDELFCYNPNIEYVPIKRYALPNFAFSDSSSTDWSGSSASSGSESETETKSMAKEEANSERQSL